jgi:hypothetical protein
MHLFTPSVICTSAARTIIRRGHTTFFYFVVIWMNEKKEKNQELVFKNVLLIFYPHIFFSFDVAIVAPILNDI